MIRIANTLDKKTILQIYKLHKICLPNDLLPNLNYMHYKAILIKMTNLSNGFFLLSENGPVLTGVLFIQRRYNFITRTVLEHPFLTFFSIIKLSIFNPRKLKEVLALTQPNSVYTNLEKTPEIFMFFIASDIQGEGLGTNMLKKAYTILSANNIRQLKTKTSSETALQFYLRKGFVKIADQKRGDRVFAILVLGL